jgi:hypothetical protein
VEKFACGVRQQTHPMFYKQYGPEQLQQQVRETHHGSVNHNHFFPSPFLSIRTHLSPLNYCRASVESIGGHNCPRRRNNRPVTATLFQMPAESPWDRCSSSHKLLCSEASNWPRFMLCSVSRDLQSEGIHEVLCLHLYTCHTLNREPDVVPCTVPYLFVIHKKNLYNSSMCLIPKLK